MLFAKIKICQKSIIIVVESCRSISKLYNWGVHILLNTIIWGKSCHDVTPGHKYKVERSGQISSVR